MYSQLSVTGIELDHVSVMVSAPVAVTCPAQMFQVDPSVASAHVCTSAHPVTFEELTPDRVDTPSVACTMASTARSPTVTHDAEAVVAEVEGSVLVGNPTACVIAI